MFSVLEQEAVKINVLLACLTDKCYLSENRNDRDNLNLTFPD